MGAAVCGAFGLAMGTKKGRDAIKKTVKYMENLEENGDHPHNLLEAVTTFVGDMQEKEQEKPVKAAKTKEEPQKDVEENSTSIKSVIERMKSITSDKKTENKFFIKPKK